MIVLSILPEALVVLAGLSRSPVICDPLRAVLCIRRVLASTGDLP